MSGNLLAGHKPAGSEWKARPEMSTSSSAMADRPRELGYYKGVGSL